MSAEGHLEALEGAGILTRDENGETFAVSQAFREGYEKQLASEIGAVPEHQAVLREGGFEPNAADRLLESVQESAELVTVFSLLTERTPGLNPPERLVVATLLKELIEGTPSGDSLPPTAVPVPGDTLDMLSQLAPSVLALVWQTDCEPCMTMASQLEANLDGTEPAVLWVGVNGPDWARYLYDEFDVGGAPTALLFKDGSVDVRLVGAVHDAVVENEVANLRQS